MNTSLTRRVAIAAVALVASVGFVVLGPSPVLAHSGGSAVPSNNYGHWWSTDGCSWVPDSGVAIGGGYYDFNHACIHHDGCYRNRWGAKNTCDQWFKNDMYASCDELHRQWWQASTRLSCKSQADLYFWGVQRFGTTAYASASHLVRMA